MPPFSSASVLCCPGHTLQVHSLPHVHFCGHNTVSGLLDGDSLMMVKCKTMVVKPPHVSGAEQHSTVAYLTTGTPIAAIGAWVVGGRLALHHFLGNVALAQRLGNRGTHLEMSQCAFRT